MAIKNKKPNSGDPCPACKASLLQVINTRVVGEFRRRYIGCRKCGYRPADNVFLVPIEFAPKQNPRLSATGIR